VLGFLGVSTLLSHEYPDQNLNRQVERTAEYAQNHLDADLADLQRYQDKSTGTDVDRSGYQDMMGDAEAGEFTAVVVLSVSRICRSIADLQRTAERLESAGVELHITSERLILRPGDDDPYQTALFQLLGVFAELEANMAQQRTKEGLAARMENDGYNHGRAPLGFAKDDGRLVKADNYHDVTAVLDMIQKDELSKRKAAERLDTSRPTINRALERTELYGL